MDVYCEPASEWHTSPVSGTSLRAQDAISNASRTRLVRMLIDAFHPTIRRENTSVMNAT